MARLVILVLALALSAVVALLPATALAAEGQERAGGAAAFVKAATW